MSPLGQTEIFTPAPTRRLLVRPGETSWFGIDPSTKRVAIATVTGDGLRGGEIVSIPTLTGAKRLAVIRRETFRLMASLVEVIPPGLVVVEKPSGFGKKPNPELAYAVGAVLCAVAEAVPDVHVEMVESAKWKLAVCGYGAIKKPKPTSKEPYAVLEWARAQGYNGSSWDEADAWAIADYGRRTFMLEER